MSLGNIHYSEEALISIIKTEASANHNVTITKTVFKEEEGTYIFSLDVTLPSVEKITDRLKTLQTSILSVLKDMTELTNVKVNICLKSIK